MTLMASDPAAFVAAATPTANRPSPALRAGRAAASVEDAAAGKPPASLGACAATVAVAAVATAAASRRRVAGRRSSAVTVRAAQSSQTGKTTMSQALPWMAAPPHLTSDPLNKDFPGDLGFDPLGLSSDDFIKKAFQGLGVDFNARRWYREAELMHGRVAMGASFNFLLRETPASGLMPDALLEKNALMEFVQFMAILEGIRGWRLLVNQDAIAGDLLGMTPAERAQELQGVSSGDTLAEKTYKELQNGRLAMLAVAGIGAQYAVTGRAVGMDFFDSLNNLTATLPAVFSDDLLRDISLSIAGLFMVGNGLMRATNSTESNSIADKAINPLKVKFGVQDAGVPLPAGVTPGQLPQRLEVTEEQVIQFEEDGVIMIRGAMKDWVPYLQGITEHQIENPHVWSLVGRMSGLYDYIQRNMWMTNDGFRDFLYYSPLGHLISQLGRTKEVRCTTDMLLVNPNKGFGWHQDNQNGPIDFPDAMRWWVAMDKCGENDFGAPEYLCGSHRNKTVSDTAVFVNLEDGDLSEFPRRAKFVAEPGDLIIWDARTIHRIISPPGQRWEEGTQRRALGGTVAKDGAVYLNKGGASGISDLAGHSQKNGEKLSSPYFPRIFPERDLAEEQMRANRKIIGRSPKKMAELAVSLASNAGKYISFTKVVGKKD